MRAQVEGVVHAVAEATTAQPSSGGGGGKARGTNGVAPKWNRSSALVSGGRGPHWPLRVGASFRPLLQGFSGPLGCSFTDGGAQGGSGAVTALADPAADMPCSCRASSEQHMRCRESLRLPAKYQMSEEHTACWARQIQGTIGRAAAAAAAVLPRPPQRGVAWRLASQQQRTGWALEALAGLAAASRQVGEFGCCPAS
jgi:hypothetical protein